MQTKTGSDPAARAFIGLLVHSAAGDSIDDLLKMSVSLSSVQVQRCNCKGAHLGVSTCTLHRHLYLLYIL